MGMDADNILFLQRGINAGIKLDRAAILGRSALYIRPNDLPKYLPLLPEDSLDLILKQLKSGDGGLLYADEILRLLGAQNLACIDYVNYEGAAGFLKWDLNEPIPREYHSKFSTIIDHGTLEHVMDFCQALINSMNLVEPGGHLILSVPLNNFCGHGFYQVSSEFIQAALGPGNGFEIEEMIACELRWQPRWYSAASPELCGGRIELINQYPCNLMVRARRISDTPVSKLKVAQHKFQKLWTEDGRVEAKSSFRRAIPYGKPPVGRFRCLTRLVWLTVPFDVLRIFKDGALRGLRKPRFHRIKRGI